MAAKLSCHSLENICGWMAVLYGKAYYTGYFTGKVSRYRSIHEKLETFPPRTIYNAVFYIQYLCIHLYCSKTIAVTLTAVS